MKYKRIAVMLAVILIMVSTFCACTSERKLVGKYEGTAGSYLVLNKNGTCFYGEDGDKGTGKGTWYVEDEVLHLDIDTFDYDLYASVEDVDGGFLLEADSLRWNDEYFSKVDK